MLTCPPLLCITQTLPCTMWTLPSAQQGNSLGGSEVGVLAQEILHMCGPISLEYPWEVMLDLCFYRDPGKEEQATAEKAATTL